MTADGSEDSLIRPEGLTNYSVPPPIAHLEPSRAVAVANSVKSSAPPPADDVNEEEQEEENFQVEREDREEDRA